MDMAQLREKGITMFDYVKVCGSAFLVFAHIADQPRGGGAFLTPPPHTVLPVWLSVAMPMRVLIARRSWSLTQGIAPRTWTTSSSRPTAARAQCTPRYVRGPGPAIRGCLLRTFVTHFLSMKNVRIVQENRAPDRQGLE
jgi:hypothetical protein